MWQEPDLADVDVPGVAVICGHDDVLGVLRGEPRDQARMEETHLFLTKQNNFGYTKANYFRLRQYDTLNDCSLNVL